MIIRIRLPSCPLFEGIAPEALLEELARLQAAERKYKAGETLLAAGSPTSRMGLVLEGELHAILPLPQGRQLLQSRLLRGELFGQLLALDGEQRLFLLTTAAHLPNTAYSAGTITVLPADGMLYPGESHRSSAL